MLLTLSGRSFIIIQYNSFPLFPVAYPSCIAKHYKITSSVRNVRNDVIFPYGCEARAINLGSKNMKIGIFTGGTSVRSKNIFTATSISRYPTGKHEINCGIQLLGKPTDLSYVIVSRPCLVPLFGHSTNAGRKILDYLKRDNNVRCG